MSSDKENSVELAYSEFNYGGEQGEAKLIVPIIISHCLLSNRKTWDRVASDLAHKTGKMVYSLDLRNHGSSPDNPNGQINDYMADLKRFLKLKEIHRCNFIGHSLGGKIQLQLAFEKPEMVESIILVDYLPITTPKFLFTYMKNCIPVLKDILEELNENGICKMDNAQKYIHEELKINKIDPDSFRQTLVSSLNLTDHGFEWAMNLDYLDKHLKYFMDADTEGKCYAGPTLVLSPATSLFVTPKKIEEVSEVLPNLKHKIMDNVTHHLHMDDPRTFVHECVQFWKRL